MRDNVNKAWAETMQTNYVRHHFSIRNIDTYLGEDRVTLNDVRQGENHRCPPVADETTHTKCCRLTFRRYTTHEVRSHERAHFIR